MWSGWLRGSSYWVLLVWGRFCVWEAIIPDGQEHFLTPSARRNTHLFGGLGLKRLDDDGEVIGFLIHEVSSLKEPSPWSSSWRPRPPPMMSQTSRCGR